MVSLYRVCLACVVVFLVEGCGRSKADTEPTDTQAPTSTLGINEGVSDINGHSRKIMNAATSDWCSAAKLVAKSHNASHLSQFDSICNTDGSAKKAFADLIAKPYAGAGTPTPTPLAPIVARDGNVSYLFGAGIKTQISSRLEFENVLVKQGDIENEKNLIRFQGANPVKVEITNATADESDKWVRGWKIDETSVQRVVIVDVRTSYSYVADQYDLGEDKFLYLSTITESRETMKDYQIMMAGLNIDGVGYVVMIGQITVSDHGYPSIAKSTLQSQVNKSIQFVHKNAVASSSLK